MAKGVILMPIYEYECTSCHHQFDLLQKISDEPIKLCPHCHKDTAIKQVSAPGFQLKGTGWYATDFKDKSKATVTPGSKKDAATKTETTTISEASTTTSTATEKPKVKAGDAS